MNILKEEAEETDLIEIGTDPAYDDTLKNNFDNNLNSDGINFNENLVPYFSEEYLNTLATSVINNYETDDKSREDWIKTCTKGIEMLGLKIDETAEPWKGACSATHPLILEAAISFQAKAVPELLPATGPVKVQILGKATEQKQSQSVRVKDFMNYLITKEMTEYYPDMEKLLFYLPLYGSVFKKTYYDPLLERPVSEFVSPHDVVVPYDASDFYRAERYTEISTCGERQMEELSNEGYYEIDLSEFKTGSSTLVTNPLSSKENAEVGVVLNPGMDKTYNLIHQYLYLEIPVEFKVPLSRSEALDPYCVTIDKDTQKIIRIARNWRQWDNVVRKRKVHHIHYKFIPGFSFYGLGYFHLLGNQQMALTTILRGLVDAGQLANMQGGFKLKGTKIVGDNDTFSPGEWKEIESTQQDISKTLFPVPYKEPSQTLYTMWLELGKMSQKFADSADQVVADSTNYGPVGTTVALIEHSMKMFSAIHKRTHKSQEQDLKLIMEVLFEYFPLEEYPYEVIGEERTVFKADFNPKIIDVVPVSDPNVFSQAQRLALAQAKLQAAQTFPNQHDVYATLREYYICLGEQDPDKFIGPDPAKAPPPPPQDPLTDIMAVVQGKPIKAYQGQDHQAHVLFKATWLQDPIAGGMNNFMKPFVSVVEANIREHQIMYYQESIAAQTVTGVASDVKTQEMLLAQAAQAILKMNQAMAQQGLDQEPLQKIAEAEMIKAQVDQGELQHKAMTDAAKLALEAQKIDVARQREVNRAAEAGMTARQKQFDALSDNVQRGIDRAEARVLAKQKSSSDG